MCLTALLFTPYAALAGADDPEVDSAPETDLTPWATALRERKGSITWVRIERLENGAIEAAARYRRARGRDGLVWYVDLSQASRIAHGYLWAVDSVDWEHFFAREAAYTREAGQQPTAWSEMAVDGDVLADQERSEGVPLSWTAGTCVGSPWAHWNGESRVQIPAGSTMTPTQRRSMLVKRAVPGLDFQPACSGVLVHDRFVLTAAHCVSGPEGDGYPPLSPVQLRVTRGGGLLQPDDPTVGVAEIHFDQGPPFNGNARADYALLELEVDYGAGMLLSNSSNAALVATPAMNLGFPAYVHTPTACYVTQLDTDETNRFLYFQEGDVLQATTNIPSNRGLLTTNLDGSQGASGSPVFSCPANDPETCTGAEAGTVMGLMTELHVVGFTPQDVRGPKVPGQMRSWIMATIP